MPNKALADSSFLFVLFDKSSERHPLASQIVGITLVSLVVPDVVLTEVAFLFNRKGGVPAVVGFLDSLTATRVQHEPMTPQLLRRAREIMAEYADSRLDFVDCCLMALAEQLNITQVCTFDRRDFSIFRPKHCEYLELLP